MHFAGQKILQSLQCFGQRLRFWSKVLLSKLLYILLSPWRIFRAICFTVGLVVIVSTAATSFYIHHWFKSLPNVAAMSFDDLKKIANQHVRKNLENKSRKYRWYPLSKMNRDLVYAIVMSEDANYFEHEGIDYDAVIKAIAINLEKEENVVGASTISQQLVKNLFLNNTKSYERKLKEYFITSQLEKRFRKNQLLEVYLNIAEFGPDIYGVNAAANLIFNKRPSQIDAGEGAFLAIMLPSPRRNYYSVVQNRNFTSPKRRKMRRILRDMVHNEFISYKQYQGYMRRDILAHSRQQFRAPASKAVKKRRKFRKSKKRRRRR